MKLVEVVEVDQVWLSWSFFLPLFLDYKWAFWGFFAPKLEVTA
jgi:hypothetical protein